jgi:phosphoribosyl-ATP pyrophosphohydrolase/phosphoribosyl-AMP cyclohydrolase
MVSGKAVTGFGHKNIFGDGDLKELASFYSENGADALLVFDFSSTDSEHDEAIACLKTICETSQVPVAGCGNIRRVEDVKKVLYAGCAYVVLNGSKQSNMEILPDASKRFGKDRIAVSISDMEEFRPNKDLINAHAGMILLLDTIQDELKKETSLPVCLHTEAADETDILKLMESDSIQALTGTYISGKEISLRSLKKDMKEDGIETDTGESRIAWSDFKLNADGLIPVIAQDCRSEKVLMLAYMNEESFRKTLEIGKMTYWSRSRQKLWTKGETSGHFQYVKSLTLDCDHDTILARVSQIGPACHTGNPTCFFNELITRGTEEKNPLKVLENVYAVIEDRREHPKEGSYTNYLFDKGIDKILKKVGEENTEIIIAAKNPDASEIKYEISDYLYHLMVLMSERGVTWDEIMDELSRR